MTVNDPKSGTPTNVPAGGRTAAKMDLGSMTEAAAICYTCTGQFKLG